VVGGVGQQLYPTPKVGWTTMIVIQPIFLLSSAPRGAVFNRGKEFIHGIGLAGYPTGLRFAIKFRHAN